METLHLTVRTRTTPSINGLMAALVAELVEAEGGAGFDPLAERLTLLAVWADLCRLADETPPALIRRALGLSPIPAPAVPQSGARRAPVTRLCARLLAELIAGDVPQPLYQRFTVGLIWADLCRLAGEAPPAPVAALLDAPAAIWCESRPALAC